MNDATHATSLDDVCRLLATIRDLLHGIARLPAELLGRDEVATLLGMGTSTFDRLRAARKIGPRPVECGGVKFAATEVRAWLANRDPAGELYDADSWPAVWATLQAQARNTRR